MGVVPKDALLIHVAEPSFAASASVAHCTAWWGLEGAGRKTPDRQTCHNTATRWHWPSLHTAGMLCVLWMGVSIVDHPLTRAKSVAGEPRKRHTEPVSQWNRMRHLALRMLRLGSMHAPLCSVNSGVSLGAGGGPSLFASWSLGRLPDPSIPLCPAHIYSSNILPATFFIPPPPTHYSFNYAICAVFELAHAPVIGIG